MAFFLIFMAALVATVAATLQLITGGDFGMLRTGVQNSLTSLSPPATSGGNTASDNQEPLLVTTSPDLISRTMTVDSRLEWQETGIYLAEGSEVAIEVLEGSWTGAPGIVPPNSGNGSAYICAEIAVDPSGCVEPLPSAPQDSLIGRVSDQIFYIGSGTRITIQVAGRLDLRMNDDPAGLQGNAGVLTVRITVYSSES